MVAALVAVVAAVALTSCSSAIVESLKFNDRMLVKVPQPAPVETDRHVEGWYFRHIVQAPRDKKVMGNWYVAWQDGALERQIRPWRLFMGRWARARQLAPALGRAAKDAFGVYPSMIEPSLAFAKMSASKDRSVVHPTQSSEIREAGHDLFLRDSQTSAWAGSPNPAWHLDGRHSQLDLVRQQGNNGAGIRIGILDNGFTQRDVGAPNHVEEDLEGDALDYVLGTPRENLVMPGSWGGPHGTATAGLLAGPEVTFWKDRNAKERGEAPLYRGYLGGAPEATIVLVRISPWVFSIDTASMAYGIDYASRVKKCDVLSISNGGSPSEAWVDAVNAAYERGTAMFAAEGDFFTLSGGSQPPTPIVVPSSAVYPAAFRRVIGVTGVTEEGTSYARNAWPRLFRNIFNIGNWASRGSYGPDGWREHFKNEADADPAQARLGMVHAYPVGGYSPNVPWLVAPKNDKAPADVIDFNGSGTSAATPQVAAAAALWLSAHRHDTHVSRGKIYTMASDWNTWRKAEAVYFALLATADRNGKVEPDEYLGAGALRAAKAMNLTYGKVEQMHDPNVLNFERSGRDYFDGTRSFWTLLLGKRDDVPPFRDRADLLQEKGAIADCGEAYQRLYYNMLLLEAWHKGHTPRDGAPAKQLWDKAGKEAGLGPSAYPDENQAFAKH